MQKIITYKKNNIKFVLSRKSCNTSVGKHCGICGNKSNYAYSLEVLDYSDYLKSFYKSQNYFGHKDCLIKQFKLEHGDIEHAPFS
jgi:hypothetical protein